MKLNLQALNDASLAAQSSHKKAGNGDGGDFKSVLEAVQLATPAQQLEDVLKMTPVERMRAGILKQLGLSEAQLEAMPPDKRKAVEDQIAAMIKQRIEDDAMKKAARASLPGMLG